MANNTTEIELKGIRIAAIRGDNIPLTANPSPIALYKKDIAKLIKIILMLILENLRNLNYLMLSHNQISELKGLENLTEITGVNLEGNLLPKDFLKQFTHALDYVNYCRNGNIYSDFMRKILDDLEDEEIKKNTNASLWSLNLYLRINQCLK